MTSTEKLLAFLEQLDERSDDELAEALPVPPAVARMAIGAASMRVPNDHEQLDQWALQAAHFCLQMRSDDAPVFELAAAGDVLPEAAG
jgi:hypothetical protein